eukprot:TRINITY_DN10321_c0_g2_i4.p2 TRINITY_DN10321_c0_g2~~TRINITY_DN10321_c0_g2_i4.p2  ORF type:complete len:290 (+),score=46.78 TRINITY_DN10321_c0_g2_i4:1724-2593(+)
MQRVLVTGASSGIGLAAARVLARGGAKVCLVGRNEEALKQLGSELDCHYVAADLTEDGACKSTVDTAVEKLGGLSGLVNCAGILKGGAMGTPACDMENYNANFTINTRVPFEMMNLCIPHLKKAESSAIVNVTSVNGKQSFAGCASYCASKAATDMLTKCAAVDLAPFGVRVNSVNPGVIITELQKRGLLSCRDNLHQPFKVCFKHAKFRTCSTNHMALTIPGGLNEEQYAAFVQRSVEVTHPLAAARGKVGQPEEVGELIAFLLSDKAGFITGECIAIDGGRQCLGAR